MAMPYPIAIRCMCMCIKMGDKLWRTVRVFRMIQSIQLSDYREERNMEVMTPNFYNQEQQQKTSQRVIEECKATAFLGLNSFQDATQHEHYSMLKPSP